MEEKVGCRTPAVGREGVTHIPRWKFDALRDAILTVLSRGDIRFSDLKEAVRGELSEDILGKLGSLGWHMTCVKLELEVRGEIERSGARGPQVIGLSPT